MSYQQLINKLSTMSLSQLQAVYNNSSRNHYNDIDADRNKFVMDAIEFVCGLKGIVITGDVGTYELSA